MQEVVACVSSLPKSPGARWGGAAAPRRQSIARCSFVVRAPQVHHDARSTAVAATTMIMRNTIYCLTEDEPDHARITESILQMIGEVQKYVPGYKLVNGPIFDGNKVSVFLEVAGLGDYLPKYAGNLDIMTAAATRTAEMLAAEILAGKIQLKAVETV